MSEPNQVENLIAENAELRSRLKEAEEALSAIRAGETVRQAQQSALERSEARFRRVFESNVVGMIRWDLDSSLILDANDEFLRMTGYSREDLLSGLVNFRKLTPLEWTPRNEASIRLIRENGYAPPYEKEYFRKDGSRFPFIIAGTRFEDSPSEGISFIVDISEARRARDLLRASEQRLRYAMDATLLTFTEVEFATGRVRTAENFSKVVGYQSPSASPEGIDLNGAMQLLITHVHPSDQQQVRRAFEDFYQKKPGGKLEYRIMGDDGQERWIEARWSIMFGTDDKPVRAFATQLDITERKQTELRLREAKEEAEAANRRKDHFLAVLSHELRTPLTPILLAAAALGEDERLPVGVRSQIAMIERNVCLEASLIDDLLDLSRVAVGKLIMRTEPCDLHSLIGLVIEMVLEDAQRKRIVISCELSAQRTSLVGDPARLQQVFWNLLRNSVKFTPNDGRIRMRSWDRVRTPEDGGECVFCVEVTDTGIGFTPSAAEHIFEPFDQGGIGHSHQFGGLGLGLSIAAAIVEQHNGAIRAESPGPDSGATFTVELPGATRKVVGNREMGELPENRLAQESPMRLLLVEDHEATRDSLSLLLRRAGHYIVDAKNVTEARNAAKKERFDLVISDLGLPDGSGNQLMQELRETYGLRGIALSGYGMEEDMNLSRAAGFVAHLIKPVQIKELRSLLRNLTATDA